MLSTLRSFLNRHRRKFVVGGLLVGGFVLMTRYSQRKMREWQEKEVRELLQISRRNQHFESTERSCNQMIMQLSQCLRNSVTKCLDTESVVDRLRNGKGDKIAAWNELKCLAISRSAVMIYSTTMLVVTLRIQLNIVGGRMFANSQNPENSLPVTEDERQEYLTLCGHLMSDGVEKLSNFIREKVEEITSSISLRDKLTLRDLEQIYWSIMSSVTADTQRDPAKNIASYVINEETRNSGNSVGARLVNETLDLLESQEVQDLVQSTVRSGFALLIDHISEYYVDSSINKTSLTESSIDSASNGKIPAGNGLTNGYRNINNITMPMAKLIPIINGQVREVSKNGDLASHWLQSNIVNDKFKTLAANIYEAFSF